MRLFTFWSKNTDDEVECLDAWDEYTVDGNERGYAEHVAECRAKAAAHGDEFRVIELDIADDDIDAAFDVNTARARVV